MPRFRVIAPALMLAACSEGGNPAPPRVDTAPDIPQLASTIVVPVDAKLADLAAEINRATPQTLWAIDKFEKACVPAQRIRWHRHLAETKLAPPRQHAWLPRGSRRC